MAGKAQEQRIEDAAKALLGLFPEGDVWRTAAYDAAKAVLEAADDTPVPSWPTHESVEAFYVAALNAVAPVIPESWPRYEHDRAALREALLADPIVKAAIAWANHGDCTYLSTKPIGDAVVDAGLLDLDEPTRSK